MYDFASVVSCNAHLVNDRLNSLNLESTNYRTSYLRLCPVVFALVTEIRDNRKLIRRLRVDFLRLPLMSLLNTLAERPIIEVLQLNSSPFFWPERQQQRRPCCASTVSSLTEINVPFSNRTQIGFVYLPNYFCIGVCGPHTHTHLDFEKKFKKRGEEKTKTVDVL